MLAEEMLVADAVRCRLYLRIDQLGLGRHLRNLLQHDCVVNRLCRILAPGKRTVVLAEDVFFSYASSISSGVRLLAQGISP